MPGPDPGGHVTAGSLQTASARPVLITGAGPAGLTAAFELARMGIDVRIADERPMSRATSAALIVHARTVDLLEQRGLGPAALGDGNLVHDAVVYGNGKLLGTVPLAQAPGQRHEFLLASRADFERTLRERLNGHGIEVEHGTKLIALAEDESASPGRPADRDVRAILRHHDGNLEELTAPYLICADGTHGTVRHILGSPTTRKVAGHGWMLADLRLDGDLPADEISVFLGRRGFLAAFPLGDGRVQCIATDQRPAAGDGDRGAPAIEELQQIFDAMSPKPARLRDVSWSHWLPARRAASMLLGHGRIFFGGDSAHAYPPTSNQGENYGIQDMVNLSWKLAMVLQGQAVPALLDTYRSERLGVIREVARRAELAADVLGTRSAVAHQLVTRVAPVFLDARFVLRLTADLVGEVTPDYRDGPLSAPRPGPGDLQPGDSVPDLPVLACDADAPPDARPREARLHELVDPSRLTLLLTAADPMSAVPAAWHEQLAPWRQSVRAHRIAPVGDRPDGHSRFTGMFGRQSMLVIRPDLYVGFAGRRRAVQHLLSWLGGWFPPAPGSIEASSHAA